MIHYEHANSDDFMHTKAPQSYADDNCNDNEIAHEFIHAYIQEVHRIAMAGIPVDVKELANCYLFVAEIPGLKNTDVKVQVENDSILKISGDRKREDCEDCEVKYIRVERQSGRFARKFNLPANADLEKISAACQDGILSVVVPKNPPPEQRKPKNLDIKIAT
ncbi:hypothetical protein KP509_23G030400 [Ceratopteris richardii]|uniref:SHSP domain-containing protein n=1 Tax=Ceratopteris richardii TaxID=49495 RepID=A0A8T2S077_CERRI|nr:hypothetical protein KP509_23G030400 [Ceratopteris richardii]